MFFGSLVIPLSVLIFYWEINIPRDIPFYRVMMVFFIGGILSIIFALVLFTFRTNGGDWIAPLFEEPAKALVLAVFIYWFDIRYIFGGLLIGAAVGAGFAAFEDITYATSKVLFPLLVDVIKAILANPSVDTAIQLLEAFNKVFYERGTDILILRAFGTLCGHVTYAAMEGGALAMVKGNNSFSPAHFFSPRFLLYLVAAMFLHFAWNGGFSEDGGLVPLIALTSMERLYTQMAALSIIAVLLVFTLIRQAIFQVLEVANTASTPAPAAYDNTPMLLGTAGPLANALFPIERRITFGRDPALCNVVFPSGTPGVSRRHCVLESHSGGLYLMDLGSSSGTFLQGGQRLPVNQWVQVTGSFYLGSPSVMFSIKKGGGQAQPQPQPNFPPPQPQQQIPPPQPQPPLINPSPVATNVTIFGLAGPMQGRTFSDPQRLIIGRDPSQCNVVLPPRTPGVSRKHCILERRPDGVYIMDVGSSAGTFSQNGQRLPVNQWIKVVGNFYLGSPNVMFSVS